MAHYPTEYFLVSVTELEDLVDASMTLTRAERQILQDQIDLLDQGTASCLLDPVLADRLGFSPSDPKYRLIQL